MKAATGNPFRSADRYLAIIVLPGLLWLALFGLAHSAGLGGYEYSLNNQPVPVRTEHR